MRVTSLLPDIQYQMQQSQQAMATAEQQVSTGLRVNQLSDDPAASANMVVSLAESANIDQYTSNVNSVLPRMQATGSALSSIVSSLNSAITLGTSGANSDLQTDQKQAIAAEVQSDLSSVIAQANTEFNGVYVFGGSETTTPPFVAASTTYNSSQGSVGNPLTTSTALTAGSITTISDATTGQTMTFKAQAGDTIATLQQAVTNAVNAGTLSAGTTAAIDAQGQLSIETNNTANGIVVSSDDAALGTMSADPTTAVANAYAYVGNGTVNSVQVGDSLSVATNMPGSQLFTSGANVLGSLTSLINALQSGDTNQVGAATTAVSSALSYVSDQRVPFDGAINQLNSQESYLSDEKVNLTSQQNSLVGINLADAASNLSQAQLDNNAVLAAAAKVMPQTLLDYLK
ncbi:MAG: flagellar hook-associated protein FlgL [Terracidiphilus sp.]|jgi:flagellar hook-associated protein 3